MSDERPQETSKEGKISAFDLQDDSAPAFSVLNEGRSSPGVEFTCGS